MQELMLETPVDVLNYALTLEHLEHAFYRDGLEEFTAEDFTAAGYSANVYDYFGLIRDHEREHVDGCLEHHWVLHRGASPYRLARRPSGARRASCSVLLILCAADYETRNGPAISRTSSIVRGVSKAAGKGIWPVSKLR